jgi:hypothetical protein
MLQFYETLHSIIPLICFVAGAGRGAVSLTLATEILIERMACA